ncbi:MAG: DnaJ domain-containing protein [Candidatus Omnitrophica bacterium]|nr:DnaJ domain-containing protein [Candidatus Omnitrophota bacterium]MDD5670624.1 DnaJ domain-containing protein [Candidatus Omnitrophota bacterium]
MNEDYYKIMEVHPKAGIEMIDKAYRTLAMRYHPAKNLPSRLAWAEEKFKQLSLAYSVLKDPVQRREYDRTRLSTEMHHVRTAPNGPDIGEEEAYFQYRIGCEHAEKAQKAPPLNILFGKSESDREKAREAFETVFRKYPGSKYAEEALYRWLLLSNRMPDHSEAFLKKLEECFEIYADNYSSGPWSAEVKLEFARFRILKKKDTREAKKIIHYLRTYYSDSDVRRETEVLAEYLEGLDQKKNRHRARERVRG